MAHEITIRSDGFAEAAYTLLPAWHNLGKVYDKPMTSAQALTGAGLDWPVVQQAMGRFVHPPEKFHEYIEDPAGYIDQYGNPWGVMLNDSEEPKVLANVRGDNGLYLGNVTDQYTVVQNTEAFAFLDALVDDGSMRYEAAFSLSGGRRVVMLAQMPGAFQVVDGDDQLPYVLMSLHHDGTGAIKFGPTIVRVVCANTYRVAVESEAGKRQVRELTISHKGNVMEKLAEARDILLVSRARMEEHNAKCVELAKCPLELSQWMAFLNVMCPELVKEDPDYTERRAQAIADTRAAIRDAYYNERQATAPRTAWAAFNAVTEHIDHLPRRGATEGRRIYIFY